MEEQLIFNKVNYFNNFNNKVIKDCWVLIVDLNITNNTAANSKL